MKRKHSRREVELPRELLQLIASQLDEPWFTDLRACLRWHQCCSKHWNAYCTRAQDQLHYLWTQKREYEMAHGGHRHVDRALNFARLTEARTQAALLIAIEARIDEINTRLLRQTKTALPRDDPFESRFYVPDALVNLNELINFHGGTNPQAMRLLQRCRDWVYARYGWCLQLREKDSRQYLPLPWALRTDRSKILELGLSVKDDDPVLRQRENLLKEYEKFNVGVVRRDPYARHFVDLLNDQAQNKHNNSSTTCSIQ